MTGIQIAAIVEGHGECSAAPILIRRIAQQVQPGFVPRVLSPLRVPAAKLLRSGELERSVVLASNKLRGGGGIVILVDSDWPNACPATDGPELLRRAKAARSDLPISVILAKMEFEAWFIAAAESLRGARGLSADIVAPSDPESIRDAKGWLRANMLPGRGYSETEDQPALTSLFDLNAARKVRSFDKCYREITKLLTLLLETQ